MSPNAAIATKTVTRTVFDLASFDDVKLEKQVAVPAKPTTIEEALASAGNDTSKLLDLIHEGLVSEAMEAARADMSGFLISDPEDAETNGTPYAGQFASDEQKDHINKLVLDFAKMNGFAKGIAKEKKCALKDEARDTLRPLLMAQLGLAPKA